MWVSFGCGCTIVQRRLVVQQWLLLLLLLPLTSLPGARPADGAALGGESSTLASSATAGAGEGWQQAAVVAQSDSEAQSSAAPPSHLAGNGSSERRGGPRAQPGRSAPAAHGVKSPQQTLVADALRRESEALVPAQRLGGYDVGNDDDDDDEVTPSGDGEYEALLPPSRTADGESPADAARSDNEREGAGLTSGTSATSVGDRPLAARDRGQTAPTTMPLPTTAWHDQAANEGTSPAAADSNRQPPPVPAPAQTTGGVGTTAAAAAAAVQPLLPADEATQTGVDAIFTTAADSEEWRVEEASTTVAGSAAILSVSTEPSPTLSTPSYPSRQEMVLPADGLGPTTREPAEAVATAGAAAEPATASVGQWLLGTAAGNDSRTSLASGGSAAASESAPTSETAPTPSAAAELPAATRGLPATDVEPGRLQEAADNSSLVQEVAEDGSGWSDASPSSKAVDGITVQVVRGEATTGQPSSSTGAAQPVEGHLATSASEPAAAGSLSTAVPYETEIRTESQSSDASITTAMQHQASSTDALDENSTQRHGANSAEQISVSVVALAVTSTTTDVGGTAAPLLLLLHTEAAAEAATQPAERTGEVTTTEVQRSSSGSLTVAAGARETAQHVLAHDGAGTAPRSTPTSTDSGYGTSSAAPDGARSAQLANGSSQAASSGEGGSTAALRTSDDSGHGGHYGTTTGGGAAASYSSSARHAAAETTAGSTAQAAADAAGGAARPPASSGTLRLPSAASNTRLARPGAATTTAPPPTQLQPSTSVSTTAAINASAVARHATGGEGAATAAAVPSQPQPLPPPQPGGHRHRPEMTTAAAASAVAADHPADAPPHGGSGSSTPGGATELAGDGTWATAAAVAGIAVGSAAACALALGLAAWLVRRRRLTLLRGQSKRQKRRRRQRRQQREARYALHQTEHSHLEELIMLELAKARSRGYVCDSDKVNYDEVFNLNTAISNQMITEL